MTIEIKTALSLLHIMKAPLICYFGVYDLMPERTYPNIRILVEYHNVMKKEVLLLANPEFIIKLSDGDVIKVATLTSEEGLLLIKPFEIRSSWYIPEELLVEIKENLFPDIRRIKKHLIFELKCKTNEGIFKTHSSGIRAA